MFAIELRGMYAGGVTGPARALNRVEAIIFALSAFAVDAEMQTCNIALSAIITRKGLSCLQLQCQPRRSPQRRSPEHPHRTNRSRS
jgi:hypothetical protein